MNINKRILTGLLIALISSMSLHGWDKKDSIGFIQPGRRVGSSILLSEEQVSYSYRTFKVRVTDKVFKMDIKIDNSPADLDIYVNYNREIVNYDDVDYSSTMELFNETFSLTRMSSEPLQSGVYYIDIVYPLERLPLIEDKVSMEIPFGMTVKLDSLDNPRILVPGEPVRSSLSSDRSMMRLFAVDVPERTPVMRLDLFDTRSDLDMYVSYEKTPFSPDEADYLRESYLGQESLILKADSSTYLQPGRYYISVFDRIADDLTDNFVLTATFGSEVPQFMRAYPDFPAPETDLEKAMYSTVEISTETGSGSGCLLSAEGHIVTGLHVITGTSGELASEIYVSLTLSPYLPPQELFRAELIDIRRDEDLALLKITSGLYGQELPSGYDFPHYVMNRSERVMLGQELSFLGYPQIGGEGSRVSISLTRGIVSGFNSTDYGYLIKTDGEINSGNSGGAAFNNRFQLIGLPMSVISDEGGQIAYIHPVSLIPDEWLALMEE